MRGVIPPIRLGGAALDLSPMILLIGIYIIQIIVERTMFYAMTCLGMHGRRSHVQMGAYVAEVKIHGVPWALTESLTNRYHEVYSCR